MITADAAWDAHIKVIRRRRNAYNRTIERARRHLKALDACAVTLGVTRLRMLELAAAPVTTRAHATATAATRGTRRAT